MNPLTQRTILASLTYHSKALRRELLHINQGQARERYHILKGTLQDVLAARAFVRKGFLESEKASKQEPAVEINGRIQNAT